MAISHTILNLVCFACLAEEAVRQWTHLEFITSVQTAFVHIMLQIIYVAELNMTSVDK